MKAVINEVKKEDKGITYPCLMKGRFGVIVLFTGYDCGVCLDNGNVHYSEDWDTEGFKPLEGSVTLSND